MEIKLAMEFVEAHGFQGAGGPISAARSAAEAGDKARLARIVGLWPHYTFREDMHHAASAADIVRAWSHRLALVGRLAALGVDSPDEGDRAYYDRKLAYWGGRPA